MAKTVLITGCSSGFGLSLTKTLLAAGWEVIATARHLDRCDELKKLTHPALTLITLDVTKETDLQAINDYFINERNCRLDCLINNAGYGLLGPLEELTDEQIRQQMEVNLFGVIFLTKKCLPFLRNTSGRIINISSLMGYLAFPLQSLYVTSKFALEGFAEALYYELAPLGVQVALIEPGAHGTYFGKNAILATVENALPVYQQQRTNFSRFRQKLSQKRNGSSDKLALSVLKLLNQPLMPLRKRIGYDANALYWLKRWMPTFLFNRLMHFFYKRIFLVSV
ncbi:MAG: SDR family oxidoreductase [Gammaproteobacteria bacterium]|nr:SDR family oxidoreductase [Gammaproteobacteria bacterium]